MIDTNSDDQDRSKTAAGCAEIGSLALVEARGGQQHLAAISISRTSILRGAGAPSISIMRCPGEADDWAT